MVSSGENVDLAQVDQKVREEENQKHAALVSQPYDRNQLFHSMMVGQQGRMLNKEQLVKVARPGTSLALVLKLSNLISGSYLLDNMRDYIQLFFYDKDLKKIVFEGSKLKESDDKEFRKFVTSTTSPIIDELGKILLKVPDLVDVETLGIILQTIFRDFRAVQDLVG